MSEIVKGVVVIGACVVVQVVVLVDVVVTRAVLGARDVFDVKRWGLVYVTVVVVTTEDVVMVDVMSGVVVGEVVIEGDDK